MLNIGTSRKWNLTARRFQDRITTPVVPLVRPPVLCPTRTVATTPTTTTTTPVVPMATITPDPSPTIIPTGITTLGRIMLVRLILLTQRTFPANLALTKNSPLRRSNIGLTGDLVSSVEIANIWPRNAPSPRTPTPVLSPKDVLPR